MILDAFEMSLEGGMAHQWGKRVIAEGPVFYFWRETSWICKLLLSFEYGGEHTD